MKKSKYSEGSVLSVAPVDGWCAEIGPTDSKLGDTWFVPLVGWATAVAFSDELGVDVEVEPLVLFDDRHAVTGRQLRRDESLRIASIRRDNELGA